MINHLSVELLTEKRIMPAEISSKDEFIKLAMDASECRVKRVGEIVKLKLMTRKRLWSIKVNETEAEEILKKINCEIIDL
jgi:hypothetical protein